MSKSKVIVWGDCILDRYWFGQTSRISPEAPVPIVNVDNENYRLGGAANVAMNLASLGMDVTFVSAIGDDANGKIIKELLEKSNISFSGLKIKDFKTITKLRIYSYGQQMIRADFEDSNFRIEKEAIYDHIKSLFPENHFLVISDYDKGCINSSQEVINEAKKHGLKVITDPKGKSYEKYRGTNYITPNMKEFTDFVGSFDCEDKLHKALKIFLENINSDGIILTMSEKGILFYDKDHYHQVPADVKEDVYDVTGAGDVVVACFVRSLSEGKSPLDSVKIANKVAGISVGHIGNYVAKKEDMVLDD